MRVTPLDIIQKEFTSVRKGFSPDEVRAFLDQVRESLEQALADNQHLREVIRAREEEIEALRESEQGIKDTLVLARQLATDVKRGAYREADVLIGEARIEAERVLSVAHEEHGRLQEEITRLEAARRAHIQRARLLVEAHASLLEEMDAPSTHSGSGSASGPRNASGAEADPG